MLFMWVWVCRCCVLVWVWVWVGVLCVVVYVGYEGVGAVNVGGCWVNVGMLGT